MGSAEREVIVATTSKIARLIKTSPTREEKNCQFVSFFAWESILLNRAVLLNTISERGKKREKMEWSTETCGTIQGFIMLLHVLLASASLPCKTSQPLHLY